MMTASAFTCTTAEVAAQHQHVSNARQPSHLYSSPLLLQPGHGRRMAPHGARLITCQAQSDEGAAGAQPTVVESTSKASGPLWSRGLRVGPLQNGDGGQGEHDGKFVTDRDGNRIEVMFHDYGFRSGHSRLYMEGYGKIPSSGFALALENFKHEYKALRRSFRYDEWREFEENAPSDKAITKAWRGFAAGVVVQFAKIDRWLVGRGVFPEISASKTDLQLTGSDSQDPRSKELRGKLAGLSLSNKQVTAREKRREAAGQGVSAPWFVHIPYIVLCWLLDVVFPNRPIQRFWLLETVARMPYFSYISMLHLYETFGWWRAGADLRKVHFAEEWNELHHLQIMESLGGDELWVDRFIAQHAAVVYYWILLALFWFAPELAYNFSELIEAHAVDTYGQFADENEALLKSMPPPLVALQYYKGDDLYMCDCQGSCCPLLTREFDDFQTSRRVEPRRPPCRNLHDVFENIRDDEGEHVKTMRACQNGDIYEDLMQHKHSP